jgi:D-serine deaminase-like pyridoxal phosphate-dependent protein
MRIDGTVKGWPIAGVDAAEISAAGLRVEDLPTPSLVVRESALAHNVEAMAAWCAARGVALAPHGKTTMAPAIFGRQLAAGAWGITVSDARQARVAEAAGAERVLIANEVLAGADLAWLAERERRSPRATLLYVDSDEGARRGAAAARAQGVELGVLLEVGYEGGRTGVRSDDDAVDLGSRLAAEPGLRLAGVAAYEGLIGAHDAPQTLAAVDALLDRVSEIAQALSDRFDGPPVLTAGGTTFFARVARRLAPRAASLGGTLVLRRGCYVTHDHGLYARALGPEARDGLPELRPALELRGRVLSRPEPERAILDFGRRDCSYDAGLPVPVGLERAGAARPLAGEIVALNDQHAHVRLAASDDAAPGDVVVCGISHPCTTLERWRLIAVVDDARRVTEAIETQF